MTRVIEWPFAWVCSQAGYRPPSPTTLNGAQNAGWA